MPPLRSKLPQTELSDAVPKLQGVNKYGLVTFPTMSVLHERAKASLKFTTGESQYGGRTLENFGYATLQLFISACRLHRHEIPTVTPNFQGLPVSMKFTRTLSCETGKWKSKMATAKPEVAKSRLLRDIETKF